MITAENIKTVNERVKKMEIKGKNYVAVAARIAAFREICPEGSITTEIVSLENGIVTMKTTVADEIGRTLATGYAQEKETSSYINKTSFIENCETSAVGRALGMLGIGSDEQMASAEEMVNAINNQNKIKDDEKTAKVSQIKIDEAKVAVLRKVCENHKMPESVLAGRYSRKKLEDMTESDFRDFHDTGAKFLENYDKEHATDGK